MDCSSVEQLLDAYVDGEITPEQLAEMEVHCSSCADCAAKLRCTRHMKMLFSEMPEEPEVPIKTQAAWRSAVRAEAAKQGHRKRFQYIGGIAAALVVALGATFFIGSHGLSRRTDAYELNTQRSVALIEADGLSLKDGDAADSRAMPMHEYGMTVDDIEMTCDYISDLVNEYEGSMDAQRFVEEGRSGANLYIELPAEYAADFMQAAGHYDLALGDKTSEVFSVSPDEGDQTSILLVLKEEKQ